MFLNKEDIQQVGNKYTRIISVVPSQTELIHALGLDEEVVGITKFCVHPNHWFRTKTRVGGTKNLNLDRIVSLQPDLILANKEENTQADIEWLAERYSVYMSDILSLNDSFAMIREVGTLVNRTARSEALIDEIEQSFLAFLPTNTSKKVLYLIWREPFMAAGTNTFINSLLVLCGWVNCLSENQGVADFTRYPALTVSQIEQLNPDIILLSSEPYPFKAKHIDELKEICPQAAIKLVDGELFSWYGSRLRFSTCHFAALTQTLR